MAHLTTGTTIGGYRIEEMAGRGGMGVVYRAVQLGLGRQVALKVIAPDLAEDPGFRERFKTESRVAASIDHPNVIPVYEAGEVDGVLFLSMRYVEGTDVRALIRQLGRVPARRAAHIVSQVAAALDAAHARGLVHRDVKPANILIAGGGEDHTYLTDFGLTKHATSQGGLTNTGQWVGTADYVAPEQIQGHPVDARTDVYALGCVLYQALTGQVPFPRDSDIAKIYAHLSEHPPHVYWSAPEVPEEMDGVVRRALAKSPGDRYQSAGDMGRAALAAAERRPVTVPERTVAEGAAAPTVGATHQMTAPPPPTGATQQLPPPGWPPPGPPPGPPGTAAPSGHPRPRRSWLPAGIAAAVLAVVGAGLAVALATGAFDRSGTTTVAATTPPPTSATVAQASNISVAQVRAVLDQYSRAYSNEDPGALASLFAARFVRRDPPGQPMSRAKALREYERQFALLKNPRYELRDVSITTDNGAAVAYASYAVSSDNAPLATGAIDFHMIAAGGRLAIDEIKISD
jgi:serine/threonine protein kinase